MPSELRVPRVSVYPERGRRVIKLPGRPVPHLGLFPFRPPRLPGYSVTSVRSAPGYLVTRLLAVFPPLVAPTWVRFSSTSVKHSDTRFPQAIHNAPVAKITTPGNLGSFCNFYFFTASPSPPPVVVPLPFIVKERSNLSPPVYPNRI